MAELKTKVTRASVAQFLDRQKDPQVRADCKRIVAMMRKATGEEPEMWGSAIVGFGRYRYQGRSGTSGEWMKMGFSPRSTNLTLYILSGFDGQTDLLAKLGKHSRGKGCLYVKRLADVHVPTLEKMVKKAAKQTKGRAGQAS